LGPEVFPPWQTWAYLSLFVISVLGGLGLLRRLATFRGEFQDDVGSDATIVDVEI
jgi:hypothetical protein